jgi:beta-lactamase superfamily II metal-dependent hydrolase
VNIFFRDPFERMGSFPFPPRVYARMIDAIENEYVLFDAVDAKEFDSWLDELDSEPMGDRWRDRVETTHVYAIEVDARTGPQFAQAWLASNSLEKLGDWLEIHLKQNPDGPAWVYDNIVGDPEPATAEVKSPRTDVKQALTRSTDLTPYKASDADIRNALSSPSVSEIFVLDVGQGSANALVNASNQVIVYVDLGAGVLKNSTTWSSGMTGVCVCHKPPIILSHWHYDHFHGANKHGFTAARGMTWIAPMQKIGAGPQSAMVKSITSPGPGTTPAGTLMIWGGAPGATISAGNLQLERCRNTGPKPDMNRNGIAVWVRPRNNPILLPGDAGYIDIDKLVAGRIPSSFAVAHHGGRVAGTPPRKLGTGTPRIALSYGRGNSHGHPLSGTITALTTVGWTIGSSGSPTDERRTEDRKRAAPSGSGLGHIGLNWSTHTGTTYSCGCGATLSPTQ